MPIPSVDIREKVAYLPISGIFVRLKRSHFGDVGSRVDIPNSKGYMRVCFARRSYQAHRLAWWFMTGGWPPQDIDHINRDTTDNRWENLRLASPQQNNANMRGQGRLPKGVTFHKGTGKYQAAIKCGGKSYHLGLYTEADDAHRAYIAKAKELFGEFARAA